MEWLIASLGVGAGLLGGLALVVVEFGAWALVTPRRISEPVPNRWRGRDGRAPSMPTSDPESDPAGVSVVQESGPIFIRAADGVELAGRWAPAEEPTGRVMILIHGFIDGPGMMLVDRAPAILARGWNVAAIDLRGYGESQGEYSSFGGREAGDLHAWLDALAARVPAGEPFVPVAWGRSMGAAIALRAAVEDPRIRALVLEAPMVDLQASVATVMRKRRLPLAPVLARLVVRRAGRIAGTPLGRPRPLDLARRFDRPVVVVHGTDDDLIPASSARRLAESFPTPATLLEVAGARHADVARVGGRALLDDVLDRIDRAV
ncbi:alpha/beta hydrolase [Planctomyces sp. SH-PL62]|uniref:alpha/beta hydrolase n=1 Tax=Planctomyces sp. SH-PL62 TaxID=1636152 RepID=UPI00078CB35A|nr:alpha/beta fold hydrolase [Planctomyces sp. SH-PL62]AMV35904.1 Alpha/beta hydrolase family protein [Planctomyces sp. SH-PL62]